MAGGFHSSTVIDKALSENVSSSADLPVDEDAAWDWDWSIPKLPRRHGSDSGTLFCEGKKKKVVFTWIYCQLFICITSLLHLKIQREKRAANFRFVSRVYLWFQNFNSRVLTFPRFCLDMLTEVAYGAHVWMCCLVYTNSTCLILQLILGHYSESEIRYSKHFPLQSSFLLCFVATIVSISYFQSLISVSALSSCLYMSPNRVEALMTGLKTVGNVMTKYEEEKLFLLIWLHVKFDLSFVKMLF